MTDTVVIVDAIRTPIGNLCGSFSTLQAHELGAVAIQTLIKRSSLDPNELSEVIMGQTLTAAAGQNPARQAAAMAGVPYSIPAFTVNQLCGSGLKAVCLGFQSISCKDSKIVICGGQESMSQAPHAVHIRNPTKLGNSTMMDTMLKDGLTDAFLNVHMGVTAENVAKSYKISRNDQDAFAVESQKKVQEATCNGFFKEEIVPVSVPGRKESVVVVSDEFPKPGTSLEALSKLRPAFDKEGTVTAGNSSGINDGAATVLLSSLEVAQKKNWKPLAKVVAYSQVGLSPDLMGMGPVTAIQSLLTKAGWTIGEVDLFELNEAFASQSVAVIRELKVDPSKVNVNGGAIALGHPIGASGARILVTLLYALKRRGGKKGVAALCIGGGMGIALAVEAIN